MKRPPNFPTFRGFSTFNSVEQMARLGPHRVAVLDRERRVVGLLTQSMVVSLLDQNMHRLGAFRESRVRELLPTLASTPISIRDSALAIDAFNLCATNVSAQTHSRLITPTRMCPTQLLSLCFRVCSASAGWAW